MKNRAGFSVNRIEDDIVQITAGRSNSYLLCGEDLILIDTGMKPDGEEILNAVETIGRKPEEISLILITHAHIDHTGSLSFLKNKTGAKIAAPAAEKDYIEGRKKTWTMQRHGFAGKLFRAMLFIMEGFVFRYEPSTVDKPLEGGEKLDVFGGVEAVSTPGHSQGSMSYYLRERKILFSGDALSGSPKPALPVAFGCSDYSEALQSAAKLSELDFDKCCFGHGAPVLSKADVLIKKLVKGV